MRGKYETKCNEDERQKECEEKSIFVKYEQWKNRQITERMF